MTKKAKDKVNSEKAEAEITSAATDADQAKTPEAVDTKKELLRKKLQPYFDVHPATDKFFVTSDGQPFFEQQWAREHQKTVDASLQVIIINR